MSKALVINGANFFANKVETITFGDPIPCTGIELSQDAISFTEIGSTVELVATLTPSDTTDNVHWSSSNENVAMVSDGVVTCTGIGSATITAECGEESATCSVTAIHVVTFSKTSGIYTPGYGYTNSVNLPQNKDWIGLSSYAYRRMYYSDTDQLGGYRAFHGTNNAGKYLIPFPKGATKAIATAPSDITYVDLILADSLTKSLATGSDGECASAVHAPYAIKNSIQDISGTTANGYVVNLHCGSSTDIETITGDVVVTFT